MQEEREREEKRLAEIMEENNHKILEAQRKLVSKKLLSNSLGLAGKLTSLVVHAVGKVGFDVGS